MGLDVWFPLAIYYEDLADSAEYNPALVARIQQRMRNAGTPRTGATASWTGDVHNVDRLHLDPAFDWLTEQVGQCALRYLKALGHDLAIMDVHIQRSWPVVAGRGQRVARHAHHTAHLSAVYYVSTPKDGDAGQIRFMNDHMQNELSGGLGSDMTKGYAQHNAFNYGSALYQPIPGRLLLFPAKQTHSVEPNETDEVRVSVSYDLVITSRGTDEEGHHEFLMPPPAVWRRISRSEPEMIMPPQDAKVPGDGHTALSALTGHHNDFDAFTLPDRDGHLLWEPTLLGHASSPAAWDDLAARLDAVPAEDWLRDYSGTVLLWPHCRDWRVFQDTIDRVYVHLRNSGIPLDGATATAPVLQRRSTGSTAPFRRGKAHLCVYLRLDHDGADCALEFAEEGFVPVPAGALLIASGMRRHRLIGSSHVLHFQLALPAIARDPALALRALQAPEVADSVVFAAITAQPVSLPLPPSPVLFRKLEWLEGRQLRRYRNDHCPAVQRFLMQHADPDTASDTEMALIRGHGLGSGADDDGQLLVQEAVLSSDHCATLCRHAVAQMTSVVPDTVDDLPEYQVNLTVDGLLALVGRNTAGALLALPGVIGAVPGSAGERIDIFLRMYSPETRPFIAFHADTCAYTVNIALNAGDGFEGGELLVLHRGALTALPRRPGTAILHAGNLVHGVSRIESGTRYSLILFFYRQAAAAAPADDATTALEAAPPLVSEGT
jgi:uncharacterized protein (TIGR02466 family)